MGEHRLSLECRLDQMAEDVRRLSERVEQLSAQIGMAVSSATPLPKGQTDDWDNLPPVLSTKLAEWTGAAVLAGAARFCFILVVALILRTVVDSGAIEMRAGAVMGLAYAVSIILYGYYRLRSKRRYASLFTICGLLLAFAVVLETHLRFSLLSAETGYLILCGVMSLTLVGALRYRAFSPLQVAVPGAVLIALSFEFPDPPFLKLMIFLLSATIVSYAVAWNGQVRWLAWLAFFVVGFVWFWWTLKLRQSILHQSPIAPSYAPHWFVPFIAACTAGYSAMVLWAALRAGWPFGVFEVLLPGANAVVCFFAAYAISAAYGTSFAPFGWAGIGAGVVYLALAVWLARAPGERTAAAAAFAGAAILVLALCVPYITDDGRLASLFTAVAATCIARLGNKLLPRSLQVGALCLQGYACAASTLRWLFSTEAPNPALSMSIAIVAAGLCVYHYMWIADRAEASPPQGESFSAFTNRFALVAFGSSIIYLFGASRTALYSVLVHVHLESGAAFICGQSVIINFGALLLAALALRKMKREFIVMAFVVAALGGMKVFLFDLIRTQGAPLVLSVLSFGITATLGSLIWNRWHRLTGTQTMGKDGLLEVTDTGGQ